MRRISLAALIVALAATCAAGAAELGPGSGSIVGTAQPGKAIVRLDTAILFEGGFSGATNNTARVNTPAGPVTVRETNRGIAMYARLYPALDAQTQGGFRYGGFAEIRGADNTGAAGNGVSGTPSGVVGLAGQRNTNTLFWNRAYGYLGGDAWGMVRFGMMDGPFGLMKVGLFDTFGDGGLNRTDITGLLPQSDDNIWYFPVSTSSEYASQKISYTSPTWAGFDFGLSFAPSSATHQGSDGSVVSIGGTARQATSTLSSDASRYTNLFEALGRYRATVGGVGLAASFGYMSSNSVKVATAPREGLSIFDAGATVGYGGFLFGGHVSSGQFNGTTSLAVPGAKTSTVWLVGVQYENGPWLAGAHYLNASIPNSTSMPQPASLRAQGVSVGGNYVWAQGAQVFVEWVAIAKNQPGVNLRQGASYANTVYASQVVIGQQFRW